MTEFCVWLAAHGIRPVAVLVVLSSLTGVAVTWAVLEWRAAIRRRMEAIRKQYANASRHPMCRCSITCPVGESIMKKLFISQPMRGKTNEEILAERQSAILSAEKIIGEEVEVIDSFFKDAPADAKPLWYLGESLKLLSTADVAYFTKGWEEARGCKIENLCAIEYGIDVVVESYKEN